MCACVCVGKHKSPVLECDSYFFLVRHDPDSFSQGEPSAHLMYFAFFFLACVYTHTESRRNVNERKFARIYLLNGDFFLMKAVFSGLED